MNKKRWFQGLRNKTILAIIAIITLCALVSGLLVYIVIQYELTSKYGAEKAATVESLSYSLKPALDSHDDQQVKRILESALIFEHVAFIAVYDSTGTLIVSETGKGIIVRDYAGESHNISIDGNTIGHFEIGFSRQYINSLASRTTIILVGSLVAFLFLAGIALIIFMKQSVIQPIEAFTRAISKISPDNLSTRLKVQTEDEIGMLAMSFNRMAGDLEKSQNALQEARDELEQKVEARTRGERRRSEQLRQINEVSRRISAILSLEELLPYLVNSLQETFKYDNVNIFLINPSLENVILKASAGRDKSAVPTGFSVPLNEGIIGKVAKTGEPLNIGDVIIEPGNILSREFENTRSEMSVPIKMGNEILGVLDIQSIEPNAFDEIDLFTVQTLGDQLAVAIENARLYRESQGMAVLEERNRMAREIHDTLAQGFTGIVLQLEAAEQALEENTGQAQHHLDRARMLAKESLNEARRSVWALRPQSLEQLPLTTAIRQEVESFTRDTGIRADFNMTGDSRTLSAEIENALLRICQESLTNVKKHASANHVEIDLTFGEKEIGFSINDNGVGFNPASPMENRFGLISMRERAKLLGGTMNIRSEEEKGTHIEIIIPFDRGTT
jgi:nitrate/nitrite-specific signal transduction histidine kinase